MFRKSIFWIIFAIVFFGAILFGYNFFSKAFPIVNVDIKMDREEALSKAKEIAEKYSWGPINPKEAATFSNDSRVQHFIELEAGGIDAFTAMLDNGLYSSYQWKVRRFTENEKNEVEIRFTPSGKLYGFSEKLKEDMPGAVLGADSALVIAQKIAEEDWQIDFSQYELVEQSDKLQTGGRKDHTFVFERPNISIGEGKYRLRLVLSGEKLTELTHFVKVPEGFFRRYEEMRSSNNTIATISTVFMAVLYGFLGIIFTMVWMIRRNWLLWKKPLFWGFFISFLNGLVILNRLPLTWFYYDTALSANGFLMRQILQIIMLFIFDGFLLSLTFMAAEGLTRKAFPKQPQFWKVWSKDVASSSTILGNTIAGYLSVSIFVAFVIGFYFFTNRVLGWWSPSESLFEPNILATYFPWFNSIAISLHAGFWEECLFRAIPIAGAALIGEKFGKRKLFIVIAFVVQALIFGAGHANYAQQPSYARVVELIIPSVGFGLIYLFFGLLPGIILHYLVDVVWFSIPLFTAKSSGTLVNQILVILFALIPLFIVIFQRVRMKKWSEIPKEKLNQEWKPKKKKVIFVEEKEVEITKEASIKIKMAVVAVGLILFILSFFVIDADNVAPPLKIDRGKAISIAQNTLKDQGIELTDEWKILSSVREPNGMDDKFVWQEGGEENYQKLMGQYLEAPHWWVRFVKFTGDIESRAEEYRVYISKNGNVFRWRHKLPESYKSENFSEKKAKAMADSFIQRTYQLSPQLLKDISVKPEKLPNRTDWLFTYSDTMNYLLETGEARIDIKIAGNRVIDYKRYIYVPEEWERKEKNQQNVNLILGTVCKLLFFVLMLISVIRSLVKLRKTRFSIRTFLTMILILLILLFANFANSWISIKATFNTSEPLSHQVFSVMAMSILGLIVMSAGLGLISGLVGSSAGRTQSNKVMISDIAFGFSLGIISVFFANLLSRFSPSVIPPWANFNFADYSFPTLGYPLGTILLYVATTAYMMFFLMIMDRLTDGWTCKKIIGFSLFILLGLVLAASKSVENIGFWLVSGVVFGLAIWILYYFFIREKVEYVPLIVAAILIMNFIQKIGLNLYPGSIGGGILTIVIFIIFSIFWYFNLKKDSNSS